MVRSTRTVPDRGPLGRPHDLPNLPRELGLVPFVQTAGSQGLHRHVPLDDWARRTIRGPRSGTGPAVFKKPGRGSTI